MVVAGRLDSDLDLHLAPAGTRSPDALDQQLQTGPVQRERERPGQPLACAVRHQRHRFVLADIHRHQQTTSRSDPADPSRTPRDITTMNMHHDNTSGLHTDRLTPSVVHLRRRAVKAPDLYQLPVTSPS